MIPRPEFVPTSLSGDLRRGGWLLDGYVDGDVALPDKGLRWVLQGKSLAGYIDPAFRQAFAGHIVGDPDFSFDRYSSRAPIQAGTSDAFLRGESIQDISFAKVASPGNSHEATSWTFSQAIEHMLRRHSNYIYDASGSNGSPDGWVTELGIDGSNSSQFEVFIVSQSTNMWRTLQQVAGGDEGGGDFHIVWFDRNDKFWCQLAPAFRSLTSLGTIDKSHLRGRVQVQRRNTQPGEAVGQVQLTCIKNATTVYTASYPSSWAAGKVVKLDGAWAESQTMTDTRAEQTYKWLTRPYTLTVPVDPGLVLFEGLDLATKVTLDYDGAVEDAITGHGMTLDLSGDYFTYKADVRFQGRAASATLTLEADNAA